MQSVTGKRALYRQQKRRIENLGRKWKPLVSAKTCLFACSLRQRAGVGAYISCGESLCSHQLIPVTFHLLLYA